MFEKLTLSKEDKIFFIILVLYAFLYIFPFISHQIFISDDINTPLNGGMQLANHGRPAAELFWWILDLGKPFSGIFGVVKIVYILAASVTAFIMVKVLFNKASITTKCIIGCIFISNPFILELLNVELASIMLIGILPVAMAIYLLSNINNNLKIILLGSIINVGLLLIAVCFYQPIINFFIVGTILLFLRQIKDKTPAKVILLTLLLAVLQLIVTTIVYNKIIFTGEFRAYNLGFYGTELIPFKLASFNIVITNVHNIYTSIIIPFLYNKNAMSIFFTMFIVSSLYTFYLAIKYLLSFKINMSTITCTILAIFSPFFVCIGAIAMLIVLTNPELSHRVTSCGFYGIFLFITLWFAWVSEAANNKSAKYIALFLIIPAYYLFILAYVANSAARYQNNYDNQIISYIVNDMHRLHLSKKINVIVYEGQHIIDPANRLTNKKYPFVSSIDQSTINNGKDWQMYMLFYYNRMIKPFTLKELNPSDRIKALQKAKKLAPVEDNPIYSLKVVDGHILVINFY